jgi:HD-like signal output (HDOD) protein
MERSPFDVVVTDLNMPGMNGVDLINEVRTRHPRSSRIILSALSDQERVVRCLGTTHQFLPKPFDARSLKTTLSRICGLDAYLKDEKLKGLVGQLGTLPSFPSLYVEIMAEVDSPNSLLETIATTVARDPAMTAKILQIANSAALGLACRISSPFEAVGFLGLATVRSLVLSAHIFSCFEKTNLKGFSIDRLWKHSTASGTLARTIMQLEGSDPADSSDAYTAGLLHDIGKMMLAESLPEQFQKALTLAADGKRSLYDAELEVFGATHAGVAGYLLGLWGLPAPLVEAVAFHHTPGLSDLRAFGPLTAVHVANALEQEFSKAEVKEKPAVIDEDYLESVGVQGRLDAWRTAAKNIINPRKKK